jgi:hypothetical protein
MPNGLRDGSLVMINNNSMTRVCFDKRLQVDDVTVNMLKDGTIYLCVVTWDELATLGHLLTATSTGFRNNFTGHFLSPFE